MEKAVIITGMGKSLVIPPVTVHIPMPSGAGIPAPSQAPSQSRPPK
jgi:hypothetical protein